MRYAHPGSEGAVVSFKSRYGNFINGEFVEPANGQYFNNLLPSFHAPTLPTSKRRWTPPTQRLMPGARPAYRRAH